MLPSIDLSEPVERAIVFAVLALALALFIHGRWRYELVAVFVLLIVVIAGIVPSEGAFAGFGHPAVVTVGAVFVISRGLTAAGVVDFLASRSTFLGERPVVHLVGLTGAVVVLSAFINNIGALALLMPVAIRMAQRGGYSPSLLLMPMAFGSLLGGMTTLIGTPPNVIIATMREQNAQGSFAMFDFAPVGVAVAVAGLAFIALVGWRLVPQRVSSSAGPSVFRTEDYVAKLLVSEDSKAAGMTVFDFERSIEEDVTVAGFVRGDRRVLVPSAFETIRAGDTLLVECDSTALEDIVKTLGVELRGGDDSPGQRLASKDVQLLEAVVLPQSLLAGRSAVSINLRSRYGVNLLGVARRGARLRARLGRIQLAAGDILLFQGRRDTLAETIAALGCAPLASREWGVEQRPRLLLGLGIFGVAILLTATGVIAVQVALSGAALLMILAGVLTLRDAYDSVEWPILILLGAMIPVGEALETTGGASMIADGLFQVGSGLPVMVSLGAVLIVTMLLSAVINNAAAAVLMAPIALQLGSALDASGDPFLMAVAVGASCAFLTPIGHQSNMLVMSPGGYLFGDYWRLGLPLTAIIVLVGLPMILLVWPA